MNILSLAKEIHSNSASKGFWDEGQSRSKGEMVMLMVSELSEALEADRADHRTLDLDASWMESSNDPSHLYEEHFPERIKNTVEDEIADVFIRVLDYIHGWGLRYVEREYRKGSTGNFGHDLLRITYYMIQAFHEEPGGKDWGYVIASIKSFCQWHKIDLEKHVAWKMTYNSTRPHKHGKKY